MWSTDRFYDVKKKGRRVWECLDLYRNGERVIVKCLDNRTELLVLTAVQKEEGFSTLYESFEQNKAVYVVMKYSGHDLMDYLEVNPVNENDGIEIFTSIVTAVIKLYKITELYHADLKTENVVIDDHKNVSLIDFGVMIKKNSKISDLTTGTLAYYPPEKTKSETGTPESFVVWTLGLILYRLVIQFSLPGNKRGSAVKSDISKTINVENVSKSTGDLVRKCLHQDYRKRASLKHITNCLAITGKQNWLCGIL